MPFFQIQTTVYTTVPAHVVQYASLCTSCRTNSHSLLNACFASDYRDLILQVVIKALCIEYFSYVYKQYIIAAVVCFFCDFCISSTLLNASSVSTGLPDILNPPVKSVGQLPKCQGWNGQGCLSLFAFYADLNSSLEKVFIRGVECNSLPVVQCTLGLDIAAWRWTLSGRYIRRNILPSTGELLPLDCCGSRAIFSFSQSCPAILQ